MTKKIHRKTLKNTKLITGQEASCALHVIVHQRDSTQISSFLKNKKIYKIWPAQTSKIMEITCRGACALLVRWVTLFQTISFFYIRAVYCLQKPVLLIDHHFRMLPFFKSNELYLKLIIMIEKTKFDVHFFLFLVCTFLFLIFACCASAQEWQCPTISSCMELAMMSVVFFDRESTYLTLSQFCRMHGFTKLLNAWLNTGNLNAPFMRRSLPIVNVSRKGANKMTRSVLSRTAAFAATCNTVAQPRENPQKSNRTLGLTCAILSRT